MNRTTAAAAPCSRLCHQLAHVGIHFQFTAISAWWLVIFLMWAVIGAVVLRGRRRDARIRREYAAAREAEELGIAQPLSADPS